MAVINILDKDVYNKIAAGEVVEKPASVVKELVENSIDAGADNITIEILNGGTTYIKVSDNGCGIALDDFDRVFLPHATSKVKTVDDLSKIGTLGFRGEALSSISSVSKVTLSSKTDDEVGYQVKVEGGDMGEIVPVGATKGTYIQIEDLFYNIPARKKFLRKPKLEENDITNYISRLIMANPNIAIKYVSDNKIVYQSFGTGLYDAIYAIYGKSIVDNIFEFDFKTGDFEFSGYLGKPTYSKPNRTYQTLIINGRYVVNQSISTAIYKSYENFLMKGNFPFFVINLKIPLDKIDVNVHPNKLDVKFEDSNNVFGIVYNGISDILYDINTIKKISVEDELSEDDSVDKDKLTIVNNGSEYKDVEPIVETKEEIIEEVEIKETPITQEIEYEVNKEKKDNDNFIENYMNTSTEDITEEKIIPFFTNSTIDFKIQSPEANKLDDYIYNENAITEDSENTKTETVQESILNEESNFKILGTIFNTYILVENNDNMLIVDQHAGHERLLYDKYSNELNNKEVAIQPLLVPYIIETNYLEYNYISENIDLLRDMGFEIDDFGGDAFKVSSVPVLFNNVNITSIFADILSDIDNKLVISKHSSIKEYIAKTACRSAVKANDPLSKNEIETLLSEFNKPNQTLLCPHGRPIVIEISKKEIEKWFKRIV